MSGGPLDIATGVALGDRLALVPELLPPGDGDLDFTAVMRALAETGYSGWIVIEAEQDPKLADPRVYSRLGLETLKVAATAAGLIPSAETAEPRP